VRDSAGITIVENSGTTDVAWHLDSVPALELRGVSGRDVDLFRVVGGTRLADGRIVVADGAPRLLEFGADGELLRSSGQRGSGPGEFQSIDWLQRLPGDSIMVYDARLMRASVFTDDLRLARAVSPERAPSGGLVPPILRGAFGDGSLLAASRLRVDAPRGSGGIVRPTMVLYGLDADGALMDSLTAVSDDEVAILEGVLVRPRFLRRTRTVVGRDGFFVATGDRFEVSAHGPDGRMRRIFRKSHDVLPVPDAELAPFRAIDAQVFEGAVALPAIGGMLLDDAGNVWVEAFQSDTVGRPVWWVFDVEGRLTGRVTLIPRLRPLHIGRDFMLGVWRDDLDVERVGVYRLLKAS